MGIMDGMIKGLALAATAGIGTGYLIILRSKASQQQQQKLTAVIGGSVAATMSLLGYARAWIQGYWIDRKCPLHLKQEDLNGRYAVVTGGTVGGIGFAMAQILAQQGANVIVTVRTTQKGEEAIKKLQQQCSNASSSSSKKHYYVLIDFLSNESIREGAAEIIKITGGRQLHYLILNAGIANGPHAHIWQTNHVGPFLLTQKLIPTLLATAAASNDDSSSSVRVVSLSSGAHKNAQIHWADPFSIPKEQRKLFAGAYGQSKLANILHMKQLQRQFDDHDDKNNNIKCLSVTPGAVATNILQGEVHWMLRPLVVGFLLRSPWLGAQVIQFACLDPNIPGGSYLSNCQIKQSQGHQNCSNDLAQAKKLWELTELQLKHNRFP